MSGPEEATSEDLAAYGNDALEAFGKAFVALCADHPDVYAAWVGVCRAERGDEVILSHQCGGETSVLPFARGAHAAMVAELRKVPGATTVDERGDD